MLEEYADVMTVDEACEALRIGYNAMYELLNSGALKAFRNGRTWRIPKEAVREFILERAMIGSDSQKRVKPSDKIRRS